LQIVVENFAIDCIIYYMLFLLRQALYRLIPALISRCGIAALRKRLEIHEIDNKQHGAGSQRLAEKKRLYNKITSSDGVCWWWIGEDASVEQVLIGGRLYPDHYGKFPMIRGRHQDNNRWRDRCATDRKQQSVIWLAEKKKWKRIL
jgi:hypothetical protein